jgi:hypothetical protein
MKKRLPFLESLLPISRVFKHSFLFGHSYALNGDQLVQAFFQTPWRHGGNGLVLINCFQIYSQMQE